MKKRAKKEEKEKVIKEKKEIIVEQGVKYTSRISSFAKERPTIVGSSRPKESQVKEQGQESCDARRVKNSVVVKRAGNKEEKEHAEQETIEGSSMATPMKPSPNKA